MLIALKEAAKDCEWDTDCIHDRVSRTRGSLLFFWMLASTFGQLKKRADEGCNREQHWV